MATPSLLLSRANSELDPTIPDSASRAETVHLETSVELPYFAPSANFPHPLPTEQEIHESKEEYMNNGGRRLVRLGPYMIKYGSGVSVIEGENMLFVQRETKVPVPTVYAIWTTRNTYWNKFRSREEELVHTYIVMEYIDGNTLEHEWGSLNDQQKTQISAQLSDHINQLRSLPAQGYYGSIGRRGLLDCIFWTGNDATEPLVGPFDTEQAFNEAMRSKYLYNRISDQKAEFYRRAFPVVFQSHAPVFTHGDFQRKNIMIKKKSSIAAPSSDVLNNGSIGLPCHLEEADFDVTIIDWENSGWYPTYWESAVALYACGLWEDDWHTWLGECMELFYVEFSWMQMLRNELWS